MTTRRLGLLGRRRFGPIFATQFLGAFNDNLYRSAMLFSLSFGSAAAGGGGAQLAAIAGAIFILPYFLFSGLAGQIADRVDKAKVARVVKWVELAIMIGGSAGLILQSLPLLFAALFAMGIHSTFFGPVKYSILPQHLHADELVAGTGMVEAGTFLAILIGQIAGGLLHPATAAIAVGAVALLGIAMSRLIPPAPPLAVMAPIDRNPWRSTRAILGHARRTPALFRAILGITWFFSLGGLLTQEMVPLARTLGTRPVIATFFLGLFSIGVAIGSVLAGKLQRGIVTARFVPVSALIVALATIDLSFSSHSPIGSGGDLMAFLDTPAAWRIVADILAVAIAGGVYVVPLYALLQTLGDPASRSGDVAANNVVNAIGMVGVAGAAALLAQAGASIPHVFLMLGLFGLLPAAHACRLPGATRRR